jgi:glycosyltransferase involved in cell wall biosynthesis
VKNILTKIFSFDLINGIEKEVVVVNDCSKDNTDQQILEFIQEHPQFQIIYSKHEVNQGKGAALRTGIKSATGDYIIIQDADLELDPEEINNLLVPVVKVGADVVYGSRFAGGKNPRSILTFWHGFANKFLTWLSNIFNNINITDMEICYKLVRADIMKSLKLKENRFGFEPEVTAKLARIRDLKMYEVGISFFARGHKDGKKIGWKDAVRAMYCIVKYRFFD